MHRECREHFPRYRLQRKPLVSDPNMHHGTCATHVPWCMSGSLTRGQGKRSRHSRRMHNPQFYVSGKRPKPLITTSQTAIGIAQRWPNVATTMPTLDQRLVNRHCCLGFYSILQSPCCLLHTIYGVSCRRQWRMHTKHQFSCLQIYYGR